MRYHLHLLTLIFGTLLSGPAIKTVQADEPLELGDRRELFVDDYLVGELSGSAERKLQLPTPGDVVLTTDQPWEGNTSGYFTLFQDGDLYRMIYRGWHHDEKTMKEIHDEVTCYAESKDGIHWVKPELGLYEWEGSKANNIIMTGLPSHNFTAFKDTNPNAKPEAKYKAVGRAKGGLIGFQSPDCIHWKPVQAKPIITDGAFDSQNLVFWDPTIEAYRDYHRGFRPAVDGSKRRVRDILYASSKDFLHWPKPEYLKYPGAPDQHLYTNAILPYERAPHILLGFPTRYRPNDSQVEPILMSSRDGLTFHRWNEAVIPPDAPADRQGNRSNYMAWGILDLPDNDEQLAVYGTEAYYEGPNGRLRRFIYRKDGFVSLHADKSGGELVTKPLTFTGKHLHLNYLTGPGGSVQVEILDAKGQPLADFALSKCQSLSGDELDQAVQWNGAADLSELNGKPVKLRLVLKNADVYAVRFGE